MSTSNNNTLFLGWLQEWVEDATRRGAKSASAYRKAHTSLSKCPMTFEHPSELKQLKGFGDKLCAQLTDKLVTHCSRNGLPPPQPRRKNDPVSSNGVTVVGVDGEDDDNNDDDNDDEDSAGKKKKKKPAKPRQKKSYVPKLQSGGYAIIMALGQLDERSQAGMSKDEIIEAAQPFCNASFTVPSHANRTYTAWNSIKQLETHFLVVSRRNPVKQWMLTDEGWDLAKKFKAALNDGDCSGSPQQAAQASTTTATAISQAANASQTVAQQFRTSIINLDDDLDVLDEVTSAAPAAQNLNSTTTTRRPNPQLEDDVTSIDPLDLPLIPNGQVQSPATSDGPQSSLPPTPITIPPGAFSVYLIADNREVRTLRDRDYVLSKLQESGTATLKRPLPVGDFLWVAKVHDAQLLSQHGDAGDLVVLDWIVERKRLDDLIASMGDSRFLEQKYRLGRTGVKNVIYLVEHFDIDRRVRDEKELRIQSAFAKTQLYDRFFLKLTESVDRSLAYVARLTRLLKAKYEREPLHVVPGHSISRRSFWSVLGAVREREPCKNFYLSYNSFEAIASKSDGLVLRDVFLKMLMCIKGVTGEKALEIQRRWKTPRDFLEAFERCGTGEAARKRKRELVYSELSEMVGARKMGKALSAKIAEVWAEDL